MTNNLPPLRDVIDAHGLAAKKALGQHFLLDLNITRRIVREAGSLAGMHAIEIGPGPGGLTRALVESEAKSVLAIEKDTRFVEALQGLVENADGRLRIITGDALETDPVAFTPAPRAILANLPYNAGTAMLMAWLQQAQEYEFFALMFQKEVAERIVAKPGDAAYGRLSVISQFTCDCEMLFTLPARAFTPPPKVDSAIVKLTPKKGEYPVAVELIERTTRLAFGQRRKMLRGIFKGRLSDADFNAIGIRPEARGEELSVADFTRLAQKLG
jgi:16S rRNA (adenine1518-N6/adenine1519-N6)-dimethyltransferase